MSSINGTSDIMFHSKGHLFSTYVKFSKKLSFLLNHLRNENFSEHFAYALNGWSSTKLIFFAWRCYCNLRSWKAYNLLYFCRLLRTLLLAQNRLHCFYCLFLFSVAEWWLKEWKEVSATEYCIRFWFNMSV